QALAATSETVRYVGLHSVFPLRAGAGLEAALHALPIEGQPLEALQLRILADFVASIAEAQTAITKAPGAYPILHALVSRLAPFAEEVAAVRRAIDVNGDVLDDASPRLATIRERLRRQRAKLRTTLEQFAKGRDTAKYLQEQVVTSRHGRFVLMVRAEHKAAIPGIVHGSSASGASLFLEPMASVEINNDIVAAEEEEAEEIFRILLELSDRFRARPGDFRVALAVAEELDLLQARARLAHAMNAVEPVLSTNGHIELRESRHPLLIQSVVTRLEDAAERRATTPVPVDIALLPPSRVLLITGPNTGGKTVALKTTGLLALMAQAGLHIPAAPGSTLPVFRTIFADIGDEQSISASLSTFSSHITNIAAIERAIQVPSLVLLDEVGTGTDPAEGGALATAIIAHFMHQGALVFATTHYDALKSWGTATDGVTTAAFAFDPQNFAPSYRLIYGAPGRSLAIEISLRLGLAPAIIAASRNYLSDDRKRLDAHLERVDAQARALDAERRTLERERAGLTTQNAALRQRESAVAEREGRLAKRVNEKLDDRLRQARQEIDSVVARLKERSDVLIEQAAARAQRSSISTGDAGAARAAAAAAVGQIIEGLRQPVVEPAPVAASGLPVTLGARVAVGSMGIEGTVVSLAGGRAEVDVRGKRLRAKVKDLRVIGGPQKTATAAAVRVSVDLQPREGLLSEMNVIGCTVEQAVDRVAKFLDDTLVTDVRQVRIVHGHGSGALRRGLEGFLKEHPLVLKATPAPPNQGGGGATVVELKE
ncbi:MAG TPA: Smr/MutS family protein, partial [Vicinamibacterales bacterium]|nr:Smr/MutS family protein [Vicinamibacterales bacterium]